MPKGAVPERYRDILDSNALGHLATIGLDGRPQVNPVWFRTPESLSQTDAGASIDPPPRRPYNAVAGLSRASSLIVAPRAIWLVYDDGPHRKETRQ